MSVQPEPNYSLALEEARRGFDELNAEVSVIRDRCVSILGMGGLAASFLGGLAIRDGADVSRWTWLAVIAFVALAGLCTFVLWPRRIYLTMHPGELVAWAEEDHASTSTMQRDLALWLGKAYDDNRPTVDRLSRLYTLAAMAFLVEIAALIYDLMSR